jgi:WD40 repeat protein
MRLDLFPRRVFQLTLAFCAIAMVEVRGQSTLIPLTTRRDMVFDHGGNYLYISTSDGFVQRYNLTTNQVDNSYNLGGSLNALDIAPDDSFILAAQNNLTNGEISFQRLDLSTGQIVNITFTADAMRQEAGSWDVAIASNGLAFGTSYGAFSARLYQIDLATNTISVRPQLHDSAPAIRGSTEIVRNTDGTRLYFLQCGAAAFTYNSTDDTFGRDGQSDPGTGCGSSGAVNRDGTILATQNASLYGGTLDSAPDLNFIHSFYQFSGGVAFDATQDIVYAVDTYADRIFAFDTNTFEELFDLDIGEDIATGNGRRLVASNDGRYLALQTASGIRLFAIPSPPYPMPSPQITGSPTGMVFDHAGKYLYVATADGFVVKFDLSTGQADRTYNVGGWLWGMDIAADDSYVVVAQAFQGPAQGAFQKLDLATGEIINYGFPLVRGEQGAYDLAITSNGHLFGSTSGDFDPVRDIDLTSGAVVARMPWSPGGLRRQVQVERSADRTRLYFLELESGQHFTYDAISDTFAPNTMSGSSGIEYANIGVNRNGSLLVTRDTPDAFLNNPADFSPVHDFAGIDSGVAFDPVKDTLYGISSSSDEIVAYDTNSFAEQTRMWLGEDIPAFGSKFNVGMMVASPDGRYLALYTPTAIDLIDLQNPPPPQPKYTVSVTALPSNGGTVNGGGTFPIGNNVVVTAAPAAGYNFANWTENGAIVSTAQQYSFSASANRNLTANFVAFPTVSISASPTKIRKGATSTLTVSATTINPSQPIIVYYYTAGSAFPGTDYTLTGEINSIVITIAPGHSSATVNLNAVTTKTTGSEQAIVVLQGGPGCNVAPATKRKKPGQATVTILNK